MPETERDEPAWYEGLEWWSNIFALAQYMLAQGSSASEIVYMLEKPWKFDDEYQQMIADKEN